MLNHNFVRNLFVVSIVVVLAISLGVWTASAQDPDDDGMPWGQGRMGQQGFGMMGRGHHMDNMRGQNGMGFMMGDETMFETVAEALNLESADLIAELQSGKTLMEIATEQGIEIDELESVILTERQAHLDLMVEQGYMTQERADSMFAYMSENMAEHLDWMLSGNHRGHHGGW